MMWKNTKIIKAIKNRSLSILGDAEGQEREKVGEVKEDEAKHNDDEQRTNAGIKKMEHQFGNLTSSILNIKSCYNHDKELFQNSLAKSAAQQDVQCH